MTCTSNKAITATADNHSEDNSSSDDDVPLSILVKNKSQEKHNTASKMDQSGGSSTDDDMPLTKFVTKKKNEKKKSVDDLNNDQREDSSSSDDDMPLTKLATNKKHSNKKTVSNKDHNGNDGCSSDDDVPLTKLVMKKQTDKRSQGKKEKDKQLKSSNIDPKSKDDSSSEDDSSLSKLSTVNNKNGLSSKRKKASHKDRSVAEMTKSDNTSDNEPLIKKKMASSVTTIPTKKRKDKAVTSKVLLSSDIDSDDEPLSILVKKLQDQRTADESRVSKRNAAKKKVKYVESSSDSSDDEPLAKLKTSKSPAKPKSTSTTQAPAKSKQLLSSESSDDEPLINLVKKAHNQTSGKTKKSNTCFKKAKKATKTEDNLIKVVNSLNVKKVLRIILERCDIEETKVAEVPIKQLSEISANKSDEE